MNSKTNCCKSAKWMLATLFVAGAAFAYGTDAGAALSADGVVVDGKLCRETERRDFADGWAVRYVLPKGERFIEREETVWTLPLDAKAWYQTYSSCYENPYSSSLVRDISVGTVMSLPVTAKLADGSYCLFTEANVVGYTDSAAKYLGEGRFAVYYANDAKGFSQSGADVTPWRVTLVAKDLQTLATSDIVRRLCPDPSPEVAAKCAAFVKGGRSVWQWLPAGDPKYDEQKEWYDRTRALGFEYYLVDDGWKVWRDGDMDQWACLKKWIDYGKSIGVASFVWVDSKEMRTPEARRAYLGKVRDCGAVGIKIDFVPEPSCSQMKWYEETLADTLEFSLMTDFHGCVKPSGRERTWPHEVAREAIRGHEWHITRYNRVLPPEHDCILPFNRLVQGHADYTPMVFEKKELQGFTWARELAQGVIFSAPFLCFGDYPKNYLENSAVELIKAMPSTYDEVRVLPGSEIGECAAFAKRKGKDWFIAIENGAQARRMAVALDFLGEGKYELLGFADADDKPDGYRIDRRAVGRDGKIDLALRPCGGYCARIVPDGESSSANDGGGSGEFVAAARKAYAVDPMCRTTVVTNFVVKGTPDDKAPGLVRWYDVEGARNVRDIGGWTGLRAGRVFRGTELNSKPNHKQYELTERGRAVMRGEMGIVSDLDLRGEIAEYGEDAKTKSPIGEGSQLLSRPVSSYVETCTSPRSAKAFANALRVFADEKNYPVYVHCAGGADRTGTVCFLLETLCGVSLEDAEIEYELTSFSPVGMRRRNSETGLPFALMVRLISTFPGEAFADKVAYWAENVAGLTKDEIARIRANLVNAPGAAAVALAAGAKTVDAKGVVVNGKTVRETERRVFADGMAMRYVLPEGERRVEREETVWTLPADAKVWYQEYGMDYEKPYCSSLVSEIPAGTVMNFPVTAKLADGTYRLITEANVVGYTDSAAKYLGDGRFGVFYVNDPDGFDQKGADTTPWRVMLVAKDLQTLATSDIVRRLCPAPSAAVAAKAAKFVRPGRAVWQWLPAGAPKYGEQKEWYDRTKALGFEYYLIDAGWRDWRDGDMDQWACLKKWIDYGKSIGIETFIWVDSKEMPDATKRRAYLAKVKAAGAAGIKIDFFPLPTCAQMARYEEILADTLELDLMTDLHGTVKPSGREKTWPHEVAREAIRGHEWHITRYSRVLPPEHDCILPFNRLVQGHADYTPMVFEKKELQGYSWARELAQGVVFSARFLCFGDYPQNYLDNPAVELIKSMPAEYDETRILPGSEIGKCVAVAKRKGRDWFVAVENGAEERKITIKLDFLGEDSCELLGFADAEDKPDGYRIDRRAVERDGKIELTLRPCGGYCARISPAKGSTFADKDGSCPVSTNVRGHENIEWSTAYAYGLTDRTKDLPRVLLVGDSICNGYQEGVRERLKGKVNVSYWVSSYCATSAAYLPLLTIYLDEAKYDVIHFNNGLHSLETPTDAWAKGFKAALELIRRKQPEAKIVWCTSTPLTDETKTAKCRELNAAGAMVVAELGGIVTNDLFALCDPLDRATNWSDTYHFRREAKAKQADQVAGSVLAALAAGCRGGELFENGFGHEDKGVPVLGYQLDISRCKVPTMETLFRIVDIMEKLGYNHLELYTEHTFAYKGHETVWREASPMTPEEVRALDDYCHARGIELVPNQNSFGHLEKWLQHPEYNDLADHPQGGFRVERWNMTGKRPATLNPMDPRSLQLVAGLYDQLFPCFRSKSVNVGCDETVELEDSSFAGRSSDVVREKGPSRVYLDFLRNIYKEVKSRNHTMMFWGDIVLHHPDLIPEIPSDAICLNWGYEANHPFEKECGALASAGRKFIVCPGTSAWGSLFGRVENMAGNIGNAVAAGKRHGAQGYLLADWGDGGHPQPWIVSIPALIFLSHCAKGEDISLEQVAREIDGMCGCKCGEALLAYGGVYLKAGGRMGNSTELYRVLKDGAKYRRCDGVTDESLAAAFEECRRAKSLLCLDGAPDWVKDDFALLDILARAVEVRITEPDKPNFRAMFEPEYRRLWLRQNRIGGLKDSLAIIFGM